jgi:hypothetical protein
MVSEGTENPMENCFLSTHHPSVKVSTSLIPELLYTISAGIIRYTLIPLHTHFISFKLYIYDAIYITFKNAMIPLCMWYQNFGEPY